MSISIDGTLPEYNCRLAKKHILTAIKDINLVHVSVRLAHDLIRDIDPERAHALNVVSEQIMDLEDSLWGKTSV